MKRLIYILLLGVILSCSKNDDTSDNIINITSLAKEISVSDDGGTYHIKYNIRNEINGAELIAITDAEWITDIVGSTSGEITFRVLGNPEAEERTTELQLRYPSPEAMPVVKIKQHGSTTEKLSLNISELTYSECIAEITPKSEEMTYIAMFAEKRYFTEKGITDVETLVRADKAYFSGLFTDDRTLEEFAKSCNLLLSGTQIRQWQDLSPAKEYILYYYGVEVIGDNYIRTTPVYHYAIGKRLPILQEQDFDITLEVEGPNVTLNVLSDKWQGYYRVQYIAANENGYVVEGEEFTTSHEEMLAEAFFMVSDQLYYYNELTSEEILNKLGHSYGESITEELYANTSYMALIYAIAPTAENDLPMIVSRPAIRYFTTGDVPASNITFDVEFSNIRPRSADITITPSTMDSYSPVVMFAKNLPEGTNQEMLNYVMKSYAPMPVSGVYKEHLNQLPPATEFILAIYGYAAGSATTKLFIYHFATTAEGTGTNRIVEVKCTAYDLAEVVALEPFYGFLMGFSDYLISMEIITESSAPSLHYNIFREDVLEDYSEQEIKEGLLEDSYTSSPDWASCTYGNSYVIIGMAEDEEGNVGEMYRSAPISFTYEDRGDAGDFVELYKEYIEPAAANKSKIFRE